jgi:hypothetical protein
VLVMAIELQDQLVVRERELDTREGTLMTRENGSVASECTIGRACAESDVEFTRAEAIRQDHRARIQTFAVGC